MLYSEGKPGRVFVIRLEDGDLLPDCLEEFAAEQKIKVGLIHLVGGLREGCLVVGPESSDLENVTPLYKETDGRPKETLSLGIIIPDQSGRPRAHLHGALGRENETLVGCLRPGIKTWLMGEVIIQEITGTASERVLDRKNQLSFLKP